MTKARRNAHRPDPRGPPPTHASRPEAAKLPWSDPQGLLAAAGITGGNATNPILFSTLGPGAQGGQRAIILTPTHLLVASQVPGKPPVMVAYGNPSRLRVETTLTIHGNQTVEVTGLGGPDIAALQTALAAAAPRSARSLAVRLLEHMGLGPGSPGCNLTNTPTGSVLDVHGLQFRFDADEHPTGLVTQGGTP